MRKFTKYPKSYIGADSTYPRYIDRSNPERKLVPLSDWRYLSKGDVLIFKGTEFDGSWEIECVVNEVLPDCAVALIHTDNGYPERYTIDDDTLSYFYEEV